MPIIYAELLGNGIYSSLNYERIVSDNFSIRLGVGYVFSNSVSNSGGHHDYAFLPLAMVYYLVALNNSNYLELGGGALFAYSGLSSEISYETTFTIAPTAAIGYRYSPKDGGFFLSAALDIFPEPAGKIFPWGGLGVGYSF